MTGVIDLVIYASFLLTPLSGLIVFQLLLRSGLLTTGTTERKVLFFRRTAEYFSFNSQIHRWLAMAGFIIGWAVGTGLYITLLDRFYFS